MEKFLFENLEVYKFSVVIAKEIYRITKKMDNLEKYNIISQLRRSVISISSNIAEGNGRKTKKDYINFLYISRGSLFETCSLLNIALELDYLAENDYEKIYQYLFRLSKMLNSLINSMENKL